MELETTSEQLAVITALETLNVFLANTKNEINSDQLAELLVCMDTIEKKVKNAIFQEKELNDLIKSYEENLSNQAALMEKQKSILEEQSDSVSDESKEETISEEYGVIINDI